MIETVEPTKNVSMLLRCMERASVVDKRAGCWHVPPNDQGSTPPGLPRPQTRQPQIAERLGMSERQIIRYEQVIFAGIRMMSGRFQDAIPGLFGALFGVGVLGWGAGWIGSLTGQSM